MSGVRRLGGANQRTQRIHNRSLLLETVRRNAPISRVDLSRWLGLKKSTISSIVTELVHHGLLVQSEQGTSTAAGGRKPVFLTLNNGYCSFLGIELQPGRYRAVILDLGGNVLHRETGGVTPSPDGVWDAMEKIYQKLQPAVKAVRAPLAAVGVGIPGYVNPDTGVVGYSIPHNLTDFDFSEIPNPWGRPVHVENDAKCAALAELVEADASRPESFMSLLMEFQDENPFLGKTAGISTGIGIVIDGAVYHGAGFKSGDFKSMFWRIGNESQVGIPDRDLSAVRERPEVLEAYTEEILRNLSPLISVLDPERVVLCGDAAPTLERAKAILEGQLSGTFVSLPEVAARLCVSRHREYAVALGAAGRFLVSLGQSQGLYPPEAGALDWEFLLGAFGGSAGAE